MSLTYDDADRRTSVTLPNGIVTQSQTAFAQEVKRIKSTRWPEGT